MRGSPRRSVSPIPANVPEPAGAGEDVDPVFGSARGPRPSPKGGHVDPEHDAASGGHAARAPAGPADAAHRRLPGHVRDRNREALAEEGASHFAGTCSPTRGSVESHRSERYGHVSIVGAGVRPSNYFARLGYHRESMAETFDVFVEGGKDTSPAG